MFCFCLQANDHCQWPLPSPTTLTNVNPPPINVVYGCPLIRLMMMTWKLNKRTKGLNILKTRNPWWLDLDTFKNQNWQAIYLKWVKSTFHCYDLELFWPLIALFVLHTIMLLFSILSKYDEKEHYLRITYDPIFIFSHGICFLLEISIWANYNFCILIYIYQVVSFKFYSV